MNACPPEDTLVALLAEALAEEKRESLEEHLAHCTVCQQRLEELTAEAAGPWEASGRVEEEGGAFLTPHQRFRALLGGRTFRDHAFGAPAGTARVAEGDRPSLIPLEADSALSSRFAGLTGYQILGELGRGGMSVVYLARQLSLDRRVALKMILAGGRSSVDETALFRAEAEAIARLQHPNIVQIFEVGDIDGVPYLCLEYVEGGSLADCLKGAPQPPRAAAGIAETLARAVSHAHQHGVVHRDLKPANVLLSLEPMGLTGPVSSMGIPKVTDFGLAKRLDHDRTLLGPDRLAGTPSYMAPEQATGRTTEVGPPADVYALGAILYEMLTGRPPFLGQGTYDTLLQVAHQEPAPPRVLQPKVPRDLETITLKCLEKDSRRRYRSALDLAEDLGRFLTGKPITARPVGTAERVLKAARRHPGIAALLALVVVVTAVGFAGVMWQWRRAEDRADQEKLARKAAETAQENEAAARRAEERLSAGVMLDQGLQLCERGELGHGLLRLLRSLEMANKIGAGDLEEAARLNLAAWRTHYLRPRFVARHADWVWSAAFSDDQRTVLTASKDCTARLWDAMSGEPRGKPLSHPHAVWSAVFGPDGTILTGSGPNDDNTPGEARLWDRASGKMLLTLAHPSHVSTVAVQPKTRERFLTVCDHHARLYTTNDHRLLATLDHAGAALRVGLFSPDGQTVATGAADGSLRLWDAATGKLRHPLVGHRAAILAAAFSPDSKVLLTGSADGTAQPWNVDSGKPFLRKDKATGKLSASSLAHAGPVQAVAVSPDGRSWATGSAVQKFDADGRFQEMLGEVRLWGATNGAFLAAPLPHPMPVRSLAFSPGSQLLLTGCEDSNARLFVCATGERLGNLLPTAGTGRMVAFTRDGRSALAASAGSTLRVWDVPVAGYPATTLPHGERVYTLSFTAAGRALLTGCEDGRARLWDLKGGQAPPRVFNHGAAVKFVAFESGEGKLLTGGGRKIARWESASGKALGESLIPGVEPALAGGALLADGRTVLLADPDGSVQMWDARTTRPLGPKTNPSRSLASVSPGPGGTAFLAEWYAPRARLWDPHTGKTLRTFNHPGPVRACLRSPDGHTLLTVGREDTWLQLWDAATGEPKGPPLTHPGTEVFGGAFSPDGRWLASCGSDRTARLWHLPSGRPLGPGLRHPSAVLCVTFTPDGRQLTTGDRSAAHLWDLPHSMRGSVERVRLELEIQLRLEMDAHDVVRELSPDALDLRRAQLARPDQAEQK